MKRKSKCNQEVQESTSGGADINLDLMLLNYRDEITEGWVNILEKQLAIKGGYQSIDRPETLGNYLIEGTAVFISSNSFQLMETRLTTLYDELLKTEFDIADVLDLMFALKESIMVRLRHIICPGTSRMYHACSSLDDCLSRSVSFLTRRHASKTTQLLKERQRRTASLLEIVQSAASSLELDSVLARVGEAIKVVTNTQDCGFCIVDEEKNLIIPKTIKKDFSQLSHEFSNTLSKPIPFKNLNTFERYLLIDKKPIVCKDAATDPRVLKEWSSLYGIKSILAVPFNIKDRMIAIAFSFTRDEYRDFSQEEIDMTWGIANAISLSIENARLYGKSKEMAVIEERDRLSRELHDNLAQSLGALQLKASQVYSNLQRERVQMASAQQKELQDMISEIHTDVRETIFNMRTIFPTTKGFIATLGDYLEIYQIRYGLEVELDIENHFEVELSELVCVQVIRIIQESLTNTRKHAKTNRVVIQIYQQRSAISQEGSKNQFVIISIRDWGCGFDVQQLGNSTGYHFGLQVMQERAKSVGAKIEIHSTINEGTEIRLSVPVYSFGGNL